MASIRVVLQYEGHEAHTDIPLDVALPEALRRVKLKRGMAPHDELAYQVAAEIRRKIEDQRLIRGMLHKIAEGIDP